MTAAPIFLSRPCLVIGIPVALLIFCLIAVIPIALLSEKDNPGIFIVEIIYRKSYIPFGFRRSQGFLYLVDVCKSFERA